MVVAALRHGATFTDTARLKLKESDRGVAMQTELAKCGARVVVEENQIVISPVPLHAPKVDIDGHNDHRIVMAMAVLLTRLGGGITGCHAVEKSYPDFFSQLENLGIENTHETKF
jgi:3-phosphoshikimate 1-carboxyvinyltransferase